MVTTPTALIIAATAFNGILAGASLDQSIKQLPARHKIGAVAYSAYSQASDLGSGVLWYAILGLGAALLTIIAAVVAYFNPIIVPFAVPLYAAALLSMLHTVMTTQAAPTLFSQRQHTQDEAALAEILNRFERWQALRAFLQGLTFCVLLWQISTLIS